MLIATSLEKVLRRPFESALYAVTDKLPIAKNLVLKAKRELGIARGSRDLFQA
jgi:hypothetical protein